MAAIFVAQAIEHRLTLANSSAAPRAAAHVEGRRRRDRSGFITLAATLASVGTIPVAGIALILGVDRFMSEARALTNIVGNAVATIVVAKWENALDEERMHRILDQKPELEASEPEVAMGPPDPLLPQASTTRTTS